MSALAPSSAFSVAGSASMSHTPRFLAAPQNAALAGRRVARARSAVRPVRRGDDVYV